KSTWFESGAQNGCVQQCPSVIRIRLGAGVGGAAVAAGAADGVRVDAALGMLVGRLVGVAVGEVGARVVAAIVAIVVCSAAPGSHATTSIAVMATRTTVLIVSRSAARVAGTR